MASRGHSDVGRAVIIALRLRLSKPAGGYVPCLHGTNFMGTSNLIRGPPGNTKQAQPHCGTVLGNSWVTARYASLEQAGRES